jgi:uncharacterized membrane protein
MRWAMAIFYLAAGVIHLQSPGAFLPIMPDWVPAPREVVLFTGACEIAGALGLLTRSFRWWAAVMLALYAACVFPANVKHAFENVQLPQLPSSWWYHGPRLALHRSSSGGPSIVEGLSVAVWPRPRDVWSQHPVRGHKIS